MTLRLLPLCLFAGLAIASCNGGESASTPATPPPTPTPPAPPPPEPPAEPSWPKFGKFTDSQGRTITYGLHAREEWDPSQPRGILVSFHGNNTGTQEEMSSRRSDDTNRILFDLGLAVAYLGSPEAYERTETPSPSFFQSRIGSGHGTRHWYDVDQRLVHELLQSGFGGNLAVDYNRILFFGGSQGTCFLAKFLERYAGIYGGGFHAWCGCFWGGPEPWRTPPRATDDWAPSFPWTPASASLVRERFKVFVEVTTEDFLYDDGVRMEDYYGNVLGLETRSDLSSPGGHCWAGSTPREEIWEWLGRVDDRNTAPTGSAQDADGDGVANDVDDDDDNDGAWDAADAFPLDAREWLDTDGNGVGNFEDRDADGDGVSNAEDAFALDPREWLDTDADGIGNNLDRDDDNDGLPDASDNLPLEGAGGDQLSFFRHRAFNPFLKPVLPTAFVHSRKPTGVRYPDPVGDRQSYQLIRLGDGPESRFQLMIDRIERRDPCETTLISELCEDPPSPFSYFEHYADRIYIDRNQNGDLTDDGPPLVLARNRGDQLELPGVSALLNVSYASGETLPYAIRFWTSEHLADGVNYLGTNVWMGHVRPPAGEAVLVGVVDRNADGLFNSEGALEPERVESAADFACVDTNRNDVLDECNGWSSYGNFPGGVRSGETFTLDDRDYRIMVAPTGHKVEILSPR